MAGGEGSRVKGLPLCYTTGWGQPRYTDSVHIFLLKAPPPLIPRDMQFSGELTPRRMALKKGPQELWKQGGTFGWRTQKYSRGWGCEGLQSTWTPQKKTKTGPSQMRHVKL